MFPQFESMYGHLICYLSFPIRTGIVIDVHTVAKAPPRNKRIETKRRKLAVAHIVILRRSRPFSFSATIFSQFLFASLFLDLQFRGVCPLLFGVYASKYTQNYCFVVVVFFFFFSILFLSRSAISNI